MIHPIHQKYAELLTHYCTDIQTGEYVQLNIQAKEMLRPLVREVLKRDGVPVIRGRYDAYMEDALELLSDASLERMVALEHAEMEKMAAYISVRAPHNTRALQNADKKRLSAIMQKMRSVQQMRVNNTKWVGTLFPTAAGAQDAGMSLSEFEHFVYDAMFLFEDDPVAKWNELGAFQERLIERLKNAEEIHIQADGTDIKLNVKGRTWINSAGHRNMPSGEVFTGPHEDSANGHITYSIPSSVNGVEVADIRLKFENGKVVDASAERGEDLLLSQLDSDAGARFLGEIGIGTNYRIQRPIKSILYDEKIGGTVHLAVGSSYRESGGVNESAIHWDMICDLRQGGTIHLDGELFQENGQFLLD